ncbi:a18eb855-566b-44d7-9f5d-3c0649a5f8de-CDS [Sclerotinia trifoliorum]|uniref:A18eb855-566b-44d7-9f5d-3c0649a5f8de-CDS n=1 Tax=Sclerotinia trifoliorum TaxID=28548 RepID=A0A8H2VZX1_9HELO|nr:a18eb855-566b-44d7-9f5d-3c0649a5f8de-CDS [Sclerotinia trifoliorum]
MFIKSIVGLSIVALVAAQSSSSNATIDPNSIDPSMRAQWCNAQLNTCGTLCNGAVNDNTCDTTDLNYTCTCTSNSSTPGLQYYTQTLPTYICEQVFSNCIAAGENDAAAQKLCSQNEATNCGHLDPDKYVPAAASSSSSSASATATRTSTTAASATSASASATASTGAASALNIGREYGTGILAAGIAGVFGLVL